MPIGAVAYADLLFWGLHSEKFIEAHSAAPATLRSGQRYTAYDAYLAKGLLPN